MDTADATRAALADAREEAAAVDRQKSQDLLEKAQEQARQLAARRRAIMDDYDIAVALKALASVKEEWADGQVTASQEPLGVNSKADVWTLSTKAGVLVPKLKGDGKNLSLGLYPASPSIQVTLVMDKEAERSKATVRQTELYDLVDATSQPLNYLVVSRGLKGALDEAIGQRKRFDFRSEAGSPAEFAVVLTEHADRREATGSTRKAIGDWTNWLADQFEGLDLEGGINAKQLRRWGHDQRENGWGTRFLDRILPSGHGL